MTDIKLGYPNQASGFPFTEDLVDELMASSRECALNWTTQDGWAVGVMHVYAWHEGKVWLNFMSHRHRAAAILDRIEPGCGVVGRRGGKKWFHVGRSVTERGHRTPVPLAA